MAFGTAGLRARMGAGYSFMNCLTVIQTSQGLAQYIKDQSKLPGGQSVVIGYDVRKNSKKFAELAAIAFIKQGFSVFFFDGYVHTPLVSFAVKLLGTSAGVMVTASHNPAQDNGYKVYWGPDGCQINSPHDVGIADAIHQEMNLKPKSWDVTGLHDNPRLKFATADVLENYYRALNRLANHPKRDGSHTRFVYTPIHGTGLIYMKELLEQLRNSDDMVVVEAQVMQGILVNTSAN